MEQYLLHMGQLLMLDELKMLLKCNLKKRRNLKKKLAATTKDLINRPFNQRPYNGLTDLARKTTGGARSELLQGKCSSGPSYSVIRYLLQLCSAILNTKYLW